MKGFIIEEQKHYLKLLSKGRENSTLKAIKKNTDRLVKHFILLELINYKSYNQFLEILKTKYAPSTVSKTHSQCKSFLRWMNHPSIKEISLIRLPEILPPIKTYTQDEFNMIIKWCHNQKKVGWRKRAAVYLLIIATSGMRASEARALKWENFDHQTGTFFLEYTKNRTSRFAKISKTVALPMIMEWKNDLETYFDGIKTPWVLPSLLLPNNQAGYNAISTKLSEVTSSELGIQINSKKFRSTIVQFMRDMGISYEDIAAIVGHKDISVTQKFYSRIKLDNSAVDSYEKMLSRILKPNLPE